MNLTAILQRNIEITDKVTFGKLYLPWFTVQPDIYTIELPWINNQHDISCIPAGSYTLIPHNTKTKPNCWELQNVTNRSDVLIHSGNFASIVKLQGSNHTSDTLGCILIGFGIEENVPMVTRSKEAMDYLRTTIGIKTTWQLEIRE